MIKRLFLFTALFFCVFYSGYANTPGLVPSAPLCVSRTTASLLLRSPVYQQYAAANFRYNDVDPKLQLLKQQVIKDILSAKASEKDIEALAAKMKNDGSWPDIDYSDKTRGGWPVNDHLVRLNDMAIV